MHEKIQEQIPEAMRAKDQVRLITLRGMVAAFVSEVMNLKRKPQDKLSDFEAIAVIRRLVKQRKDSIEQFKKGNREDLVKNEEAELKILEEFLPAQMSEEQIREIVLKKKTELGEVDKTKMGQFMGAVMKETGGNADGALVKKIIEEVLV
ncbi:MAG: GatB/YqeY domain-containing protein [Patescibacteria group bacterium]